MGPHTSRSPGFWVGRRVGGPAAIGAACVLGVSAAATTPPGVIPYSLPQSIPGVTIDRDDPAPRGSTPTRIRFIGNAFGCGGDRFSPIDFKPEEFCPEFLEPQPTTVYLEAEFDECTVYEGQHRFVGLNDPFVISAGGGTSGGVVGDSVVEGSGSITALARGGASEIVSVDLAVRSAIESFGLNPDKPFCFDELELAIGVALGRVRATVVLDEPARVMAAQVGGGGELLGFAAGDVVPAGEYRIDVRQDLRRIDSFATPAGFYEEVVSANIVLEFPDCDGNGVNDLMESQTDTDGNGIFDVCEPMQNITQGTGFADIQDAINAASNGDTIVVAPGVYRQQANTAGKAVTLRSQDPSNIDVVRATVFSGDADADGTGDFEPLLIVSGEGPSTVIDGLTFQEGSLGAAGIAQSSPLVVRSWFQLTQADFGAGVTVFDASPAFSECWFADNQAQFNGGGVDVFGGSVATFDRCIFVGNSASVGGGMHVFDAVVSLTDCGFASNSGAVGGGMAVVAGSTAEIVATRFNKGDADNGGGIYAIGADALLVQDSDFARNTAVANGGAIWIADTPDAVIERTAFEDGAADFGGGAYVLNSTATFTDCEFLGNTARIGGGIALREGANTLVVNSLFTRNGAEFGGAADIFDGSISLRSSTISGNLSPNASGLSSGRFGTVIVLNSVIWDETFFLDAFNPVFVQRSIMPEPFAGEGNLVADPLFRDPDDGDYRLIEGSPAIDSGRNTFVPPGVMTDLDAQVRFRDDPGVVDTGIGDAPIVDRGAYEFQGISTPVCRADFDENEAVDIFDVIAFLGAWNAGLDFNADGASNIFDVIDFLVEWNDGCP